MAAERPPNEAAQPDEQGDPTADMALLVAALGGGPATDAEFSRSRSGPDRPPTEAGVERGRRT